MDSMLFFMWFFQREESELLWATGAGRSIFRVWSKRSGAARSGDGTLGKHECSVSVFSKDSGLPERHFPLGSGTHTLTHMHIRNEVELQVSLDYIVMLSNFYSIFI